MRRTRLPLLLAAALAVLLFAPSTPAQAHSALLGTDPADGATVGGVPAQVTLRFNEAVLGMGTRVSVAGPSGELASGETVITDNIVSQPIAADAPAGRYTVQWRVTSADGHPISGAFSFTARQAGGGTGQPRAASATPADEPVADAPGPAAGVGGIALGLLGGLAIVGVVIGGVALLRRHRG